MINPTRRASTDKSNAIIAYFYMLMRMRMLTNKNSMMFAIVPEQAENRVSQLDRSFSTSYFPLYTDGSFLVRSEREGEAVDAEKCHWRYSLGSWIHWEVQWSLRASFWWCFGLGPMNPGPACQNVFELSRTLTFVSE